MDPGIGLVVSNIVPSEPEVPKLPPKSKLKLHGGFLEKPHVRHALKYISDDRQREKALEVALAWKEKFAAENWKPVIAAIETARKEDSLRSSPHLADLPQHHAIVHPAERPRAVTVASAPVVPRAVSWPGSSRHALIRQHTATASLPSKRIPAPLSPRTCRWDVVMTGPVTPLSPMPLANSFARDAVYHTPTLRTEQYESLTPVTAMILDPGPPLSYNLEARTAYKNVKEEVDTAARRYCLARFNTRTSRDSEDFVPATMIKSKDVMEAAQVVLNSKSVKLEDVIITDLPDRLRHRAAEEAQLRDQLSIKDELEIAEQNDWMNNEALMPIPEVHDKIKDYVLPPVHLVLSILDEQREALRMFRKQRESGDLELSKTATEAAWAVQLLEDAERLLAADTDGSSNEGDDDEGYSYPNFLRSLKSEMSSSRSSGALATMVHELSRSDQISLRSRANTGQSASSLPSRESGFSQRSSTSSSKKDSWSTRLRESSISSSSRERSGSLHRRADLRIATEMIDEVPSSEVSPECRGSEYRDTKRMADLACWADELKKMEAMRAVRQRSPTIYRRPPHHDNNTSTPTYECKSTKQTTVDDSVIGLSLHSRFSSSSSSAGSNANETLPQPSHTKHILHSFTSLDKNDNQPTMLDHEYHQRNLSKSSTKTHRRDSSKASMHDSARQHQHLRSVSTVSVLARSVTKAAEDDWLGELERIESYERTRQAKERLRALQLLDSNK